MTACDQATVSPTKANPSGGCGATATRAAPLGDSGRYLPLCDRHAAWWPHTIPLSEVPDP